MSRSPGDLGEFLRELNRLWDPEDGKYVYMEP